MCHSSTRLTSSASLPSYKIEHRSALTNFFCFAMIPQNKSGRYYIGLRISYNACLQTARIPVDRITREFAEQSEYFHMDQIAW